MKRLLLLTSLFSVTTVSFSQINKGQYLIGGNAGFNSEKSDYSIGSPNESPENKTTTIQVSPNVGYFITDKLAAGARVSLTSNAYKPGLGHYEASSTQVSLSPFVRYYFLPKTEKLNLFADAGYAYGRIKNTSKNIQPGVPTSYSSSKGTTHGYYISAGPALFITPNTALELTLGYNYRKVKEYDNTDKKFMVGLGFQIHLGK